MLGSLISATPSVSKQLRASWSIVWVKAHAAQGVQVWSSVLGFSLALGWSDLEAGLPLTESQLGLRQEDWASPTSLRVVPGQGQV